MPWLKAFHIVAVVAWFAGLFYLPRLFVYHAETRDLPGHERFVVMERRLFALMTGAAIAALATGAWIALAWFQPFPAWLWAKLAVVAALLLHHGLCYRHLRAFAAGANPHGALYYRIFNELPLLGLIAAVLLVELQPAF
jgi:putative membrane protein